MTADEIIASFGEPEIFLEEYSMEYSPEGLEWMNFGLSLGNTVYAFSAAASHFTCNGQSLEQNISTLIDFLGNDYYNSGGYSYEWGIGDLCFTFYAPDDLVYSVSVSEFDTDISIDNDAYLGDDGSYGYYANLDSSLYGRWRENDGSAWIVLDEYGNADTNLYINSAVTIGSPESAVWEADNGQIMITGTYRYDMEYRLSRESIRDYDAEKEANDGYMKFKDGRETIVLNYTEFIRHDDNPEGTGIVGEWCDGYKGSSAVPYYVFYSDGTGIAQCYYPMTWTSDEEMIYTHYQLSRIWDYKVSGDILQLFFSDGAKIFTRVGY